MTPPWLSVLTTPRRLQYLRGTLDAIDAAGGASFAGVRVVFVDGPAELVRTLVPSGWELESLSESSRGTRKSMWEILHRGALAGVPWLLYLEDDIRLARNAVPAMASVEVPDEYGFLSFFQMNLGMPETPGIHRYRRSARDVSGFWGAQALKFPARSLIQFAGADTTPPRYAFGCDVWIGEELLPGIVLPSIVRHVGVSSSVPSQELHTLDGEHVHRAGIAYAGDDADALSVLSDLMMNDDHVGTDPDPDSDAAGETASPAPPPATFGRRLRAGVRDEGEAPAALAQPGTDGGRVVDVPRDATPADRASGGPRGTDSAPLGCQMVGCGHVALYLVSWPGQPKSRSRKMCLSCAAKAVDGSRVCGLAIDVTPAAP